MKNADEAELMQVASEPVDANVYNVNDFHLLSKLVTRLVHILCRRIEDRGVTKSNHFIFHFFTYLYPRCCCWELCWHFGAVPAGVQPAPTEDPVLTYPSPTDLRFSDLGSREVKLHWTNPTKAVQQYRVVYHSAEGQRPQEVRTTHIMPMHLLLSQKVIVWLCVKAINLFSCIFWIWFIFLCPGGVDWFRVHCTAGRTVPSNPVSRLHLPCLWKGSRFGTERNCDHMWVWHLLDIFAIIYPK